MPLYVTSLKFHKTIPEHSLSITDSTAIDSVVDGTRTQGQGYVYKNLLTSG